MRLLPFVVSTPYKVQVLEHSLEVYRIAFLLQNAEKIWEEDTATLEEVLKINDLVPKKLIHSVSEEPLLIPIDPKQTVLTDFYFYEDVDAPTEGLIWRSFFYIHDATANKNFMDSWKYPKHLIKYIHNALKVWHE